MQKLRQSPPITSLFARPDDREVLNDILHKYIPVSGPNLNWFSLLIEIFLEKKSGGLLVGVNTQLTIHI